MPEPVGQDAVPLAPGCRCVLLHAPDRDPDAALIEALRARGVEPVRVTNAYAALAALCAREGHDAGPAPRTPLVLLLDEPERVQGRARLVAAAARYAPRAACWTFESRATPSLRPLVEPHAPHPADHLKHHPTRLPNPGHPARHAHTAPAEASTRPDAAPEPVPQLHLAPAHGLEPRHLTAHTKLPEVDTGRLLTPDEVEALMGITPPAKNGRTR
jgi:hypothetical protein